ncbi:MAG: hypothetical protein GY716_10765 [bacterium]|nr:hypothetical protein [bacterium]
MKPAQQIDDRSAQRVVSVTLAGALFFAAALATLAGADAARSGNETRTRARDAVDRSLETEGRSPAVRDALRSLRTIVEQRPLNARARVDYAALILAVAADIEESSAAAFHARIAAKLSPVTVPVVRRSAIVLARCRDVDHAQAITRRMFGYDPDAAARLLSQLEPLLYDAELHDAIPDNASAWMAWCLQLRVDARTNEGLACLQQLHDRWPDHVPALDRLAAAAVRTRNWDDLAALFPPQDDREATFSATSFTLRARLRAARGDRAGAQRDLRRALDTQDVPALARALAGETLEQLGDIDGARREWNRLLYELPDSSAGARIDALRRLARMEASTGHSGVALRHWHSLLALAPDDREALQEVDRLHGG